METRSNKDSIYIGRFAGKEIHEKIKNAKKSVKVVSPYLSPEYIKDLIALHKKQVDITLVTCDRIETNSYSDFKTSDLLKEEKIQDNEAVKSKKAVLFYLIIIFGVFLMNLLLYIIFFSLLLIILTGISLIIGIILLISYFLIETYSYKYEPLFRIKVFDSHSGDKPWSTNLVHSKIFIIDEEIAFLGSVNFTYSGFKTHYETTIKVEDLVAVHAISQEVEKLYSSSDLRAKSVEEWM